MMQSLVSYHIFCMNKTHSFKGICKSGETTAVPYWAINQGKAYRDYRTCCRHSFDEQKCLNEGPAASPTNKPSGEDSANPSSIPTGIISSRPSSQPIEGPKPTTTPTSLYWDALNVSTDVFILSNSSLFLF